MKRKLLSILALLLMAVSQGAWADTRTFSNLVNNTNKGSSYVYTSDPIKVTFNHSSNLSGYISRNDGVVSSSVDVQSLHGEVITGVQLTGCSNPAPSIYSWTVTTPASTGTGTSTYTITGLSNTSVRIEPTGNMQFLQFTGMVVTYAYVVTLNQQDGSGGTNSVNVSNGSAMPSATMPTRTGYTFLGYYDATSGGTQYYNADGTSARNWDKTSNTTLYAQWTPIASYNVTANSASEAYWATFYSNAGNYQAAEGTQVFTVSLAGTGITMHEVSDRIAKSGQGVVLKKTTTGNFTMTLTETAPAGDFSSNSLTGTMTSITNPGNAYVLGGTNGAGFYKLKDTGTIGANKAYLTYSGGGAAAARGFFLFDETTGIEMPTAEDGNADAVVFDLQGRRVLNPTNGLYIVNGKKVFINK